MLKPKTSKELRRERREQERLFERIEPRSWQRKARPPRDLEGYDESQAREILVYRSAYGFYDA